MWSSYVLLNLFLIISIGSCHILQKNVDDIETASKDSECAVKIIGYVAEEGPKAVTVIGIDNDMGAELLRIDRITIVPILTNINNDYLKTDVYVVMSEDLEDFKKKIFQLEKDSYWQPRSYFIICIKKVYDIEKLTEFLKSHNIFQVSIIIRNLENFEIYSFSAKLDNCNRPQNLELTTNCFLFNKSRIFMKSEPKKFNNCHIKFAAHAYLPYSGVYPLTNDIGFEEHILNLIEEKESIKFDVIKFATAHKFGIQSNGSFVGMLDMLQKHTIDGVVGGLFLLYDKCVTFDYMYPYMIDNLRVVLPLAVRLSTWEAVWATLSLATKLLIILLFAIFFFAISYLAIYKNYRKDLILDFLIVYGYFLNNIIPKQLKDFTSHRLLILSMLLFAFFINVAIQASVSSVTTKPMHSYQIKEEVDISRSHTNVFLKVLGGVSQVNTCDSILDCLSIVRNSRYKRRKFCTFVSEMVLPYQQLQFMLDTGNWEMYVADFSLFLYQHTLYLNRGSIITPVIRKYYRHLFHSDIIRQYIKSVHHKLALKVYYNKAVQEKASWTNHNPGTFNNLKEAFMLLLSGYCISVIGFVFEIVRKKICQKLNI